MAVKIIRRIDGLAFHSGEATPEGLEDATNDLANAPEPENSDFLLIQGCDPLGNLDAGPFFLFLEISGELKRLAEMESRSQDALSHHQAVKTTEQHGQVGVRFHIDPIFPCGWGSDPFQLWRSFLPLTLEIPHNHAPGCGQTGQKFL
jgi:hypothetical protein